jgi:predicted glycosyltransferase
MKKVLFYCQHILGIGHLVRSIEITRRLIRDFQVCFINGGQVIQGFEVSPLINIINIPAIKTDPEFQELQVVDDSLTLEEVKAIRKDKLLNIFEQFKPDILMVELFPFGRRRFSFELIPLMDQAKASGTQVVCSLRDIVVMKKQNRVRHEEKICQLMNQYFDMLLVHGDPKLVSIERSFSRIGDLNCEVHYTGYVAQPILEASQEKLASLKIQQPTLLVSVGGGRFGHELLECVVKSAPLLKELLPHHIQMFTGPFIPEAVFAKLQNLAAGQTNITIERYTPQLLTYMQQADLSISMSGYNTTMNILMTGVRAMMMAFKGNGDEEQTIRVTRLEELGIVSVIHPDDLEPQKFAKKVVTYLSQQPATAHFDFNGVEKTAACLHGLLQKQEFAA